MSDFNTGQSAHVARKWRKHAILLALSLGCLTLFSMDSMHRISKQLQFHYWDMSRRMRKNKKQSKGKVAKEPKGKAVKKGKSPAKKTAKNQLRKAESAAVTKAGKTKKAKKVKKTTKPQENRKLVWLMAYPFSGSSVTIKAIQGHTGESQATNYGEAIDTKAGVKTFVFDSIPVDESMPSGPYKYRLDLPFPKGGEYVVVKTHCGGHCIDKGVRGCLFNDYVKPLTNYHLFMQACATSTKYNHKKGRNRIAQTYNPMRVKKTIFNVRDPLDIITARFLNEMEGPRGKGQKTYKTNRKGLREWCKDYDGQVGSKTLVKQMYPKTKGLVHAAADTTCHAELFRIIQFYSQGTLMSRIFKYETFTLHFEDYDNDYGEIKDELMRFLEKREKENTKGETFFKKYGDSDYEYFTGAQVKAAKRFMSLLIGKDRESKDMRKLFQRYL